MMNSMHCRELAPSERPRVNAFYQLTTYKRPVSDNDRVFVAESNGEILGAVRIEFDHDVQVLRGMYLLPGRTREGIGTQLLHAIEPMLSETDSYCIPLDHLLEFYGKIGFRKISTQETPGFLAKRVSGYFEEGKKVLIMYRSRRSQVMP